MAGAGEGWLSRIGTGLLAVVVGALLVSWAWARWGPRPPSPEDETTRRVIRVQVWNGSGEPGVGAQVAAYLREGGFHVVEVANADRTDYFASMVVARRPDAEAARAVSRYLGGPPVIQQAWSSDLAEVTVVLGSDRSRIHITP